MSRRQATHVTNRVAPTPGAMGHMHFSRVATGRKMGYAYEIHGSEGAIKFDQEDQNALWLYKSQGESRRPAPARGRLAY